MILALILGPEIMKNSRPCWLLVATIHGKPPTSDGHNFFVRTPFLMFLNSMESHFSLESIHIYLDEIGNNIKYLISIHGNHSYSCI